MKEIMQIFSKDPLKKIRNIGDKNNYRYSGKSPMADYFGRLR